MKVLFSALIVGVTFSLSAFAKPMALVYVGPGSCFVCWTSAVSTARKAGFDVVTTDGKHTHQKLFEKASLWVQPGGKSTRAAKYMGEAAMERIRKFVENGGGYTGFCAGGFLSTAEIGTSGKKGLGIVPGKTALHDLRDGPGAIIGVHWDGNERKVLYHGGPHFNLTGVSDPNLHIVSTYDEDYNRPSNVAGLTTTYGKGRVAVNGFHSEATKFWKFKSRLHDPDGQDQDLAGSSMRWAAKLD